MDDETAFLREVQSNSRDRSTRLVYADWLEERGDPRHELIRVEEEMDRLPPFADRFWELKPRRNELRASVDPAWREALGHGVVCRPLFGHGWPDGVKERWRLIREYVERWARVEMPDAGGRAGEVAVVEARLGRTLPDSVREWVALASDEEALGGRPQIIYGISEVVEISEILAVSLIHHGEEDLYWAVRYEDFDHPDPPVHYYGLDYDDPEENFLQDGPGPIAEDLSSFAINFLMSYMEKKTDGGFNMEVPDPGRYLTMLRDHFPIHCRVGVMDLFCTFRNFMYFQGYRFAPIPGRRNPAAPALAAGGCWPNR